MTQWIEVRARYNRMDSRGVVKKIVEPYLVDALSCTEAEACVVAELTPFISGGFSVSSIGKTKIVEVFRDPAGDRYYKVKVNFITLNEKTGQEKRTPSYILVQAASFKDACLNFVDGMKGTMAVYEIEQICETKIVDVFEPGLKTKP